MFCAAVSSNTKPKIKRLGAQRVRHIERLQSTGATLDADEATAYRALAAKAKYLALDRPDMAFAT